MDVKDGYIMYLSGPITNDPGYMGKFAAVDDYLESEGCRVINPAGVSAQLPELEHGQYMHVCLAMLDLADGIWMMDGWEDSAGAKEERGYAVRKGIEVWERGRLLAEA